MAVAAIVAAFVVIVAMQPSDFRIERSATMRAPAAAPYAQVNDFQKWRDWSPWEKVDPQLKRSYEGPQAGTMLVEKNLRDKVRFLQVNLNATLPNLGIFDVVFLRNVLIYFNADTKRKVISRVLSVLRPGGWLMIGHSESLHGINDTVQPVAPSIYRKP